MRRDKSDIYFTKDSRHLMLTAPERVALLGPADAAVLGSGAFREFSWSRPSNLFEPRNVAYDLTIMKDGVPTIMEGIRGTSYTAALAPGSYAWYVVAHIPTGSSAPSDTFSLTLSPDQAAVGNRVTNESLMLGEVFPSPATDDLRIRFALSHPETITFSVIGLDGARQMTLAARTYEAGEQQETLDLRSLSSGAYLLELRSQGERRIREFTVVR
jgi:hypothetical protein